MTDIHAESQDIIDRYLADRLSDAERELVETRIIADFTFKRDLELTEALRDGLRELQAQGQVAPLLRSRSWIKGQSPFAIAASMLALGFGLTALLLYQRHEHAGQQLAPQSRELLVATLQFERTRGAPAGPDVSWQSTARPTLLEMHFDVGVEPASVYRVFVERIGVAEHATLLLATGAGIGADGRVSISVHSELLEAGDYRIRLEPVPGRPSLRESAVYTLRIVN